MGNNPCLPLNRKGVEGKGKAGEENDILTNILSKKYGISTKQDAFLSEKNDATKSSDDNFEQIDDLLGDSGFDDPELLTESAIQDFRSMMEDKIEHWKVFNELDNQDEHDMLILASFFKTVCELDNRKGETLFPKQDDSFFETNRISDSQTGQRLNTSVSSIENISSKSSDSITSLDNRIDTPEKIETSNKSRTNKNEEIVNTSVSESDKDNAIEADRISFTEDQSSSGDKSNQNANIDSIDKFLIMNVGRIDSNLYDISDFKIPSRGKITMDTALDIIDCYRRGGKLHINSVHRILKGVYWLFKKYPNIRDINLTAKKQRITVCGDLHGQFLDLLYVLDANGAPTEDNIYLFNGDFVDRGPNSIEVIISLFALQLAAPDYVFLNRGNHEDPTICSIFGFMKECIEKYDDMTFSMFVEVFRYLPISTIINQQVLVMHGGLFGDSGVLLDDIRAANRYNYGFTNTEEDEANLQEATKNEDNSEEIQELETKIYLDQVLKDLLWSDPTPTFGVQSNPRGEGVLFGPDIAYSFLQENKLRMIVRSHECVPLGFQQTYMAEDVIEENMLNRFSINRGPRNRGALSFDSSVSGLDEFDCIEDEEEEENRDILKYVDPHMSLSLNKLKQQCAPSKTTGRNQKRKVLSAYYQSLLCTIFSASNYSLSGNQGAYMQFSLEAQEGSYQVKPLYEKNTTMDTIKGIVNREEIKGKNEGKFSIPTAIGEESGVQLYYTVRCFYLGEQLHRERCLERSLQANLSTAIIKRKSSLLEAFKSLDLENTGKISLDQWVQTMSRVTKLIVRWEILLPLMYDLNSSKVFILDEDFSELNEGGQNSSGEKEGVEQDEKSTTSSQNTFHSRRSSTTTLDQIKHIDYVAFLEGFAVKYKHTVETHSPSAKLESDSLEDIPEVPPPLSPRTTSSLNASVDSMFDALYVNRRQLEAIFRFYDKDMNGYITKDEFRLGCEQLNKYIPSTEDKIIHIDKILDILSLNKNNQVDLNEFFEAFRLLDSKTGRLDGTFGFGDIQYGTSLSTSEADAKDFLLERGYKVAMKRQSSSKLRINESDIDDDEGILDRRPSIINEEHFTSDTCKSVPKVRKRHQRKFEEKNDLHIQIPTTIEEAPTGVNSPSGSI